MNSRPKLLTGICFYLILVGFISLWSLPTRLANPENFQAVSPIMIAVSGVVSFVAGVAMLKAQNWSRYLFVIAKSIILVFYFATQSFTYVDLVGVPIVALIICYLFGRSSTLYFLQKAPCLS